MKYNININQKAVIDLGLNLDVIDMSIFDYIKDFSNSINCQKITLQGNQFFWIGHNKIISDMPLLRIKTRQGIFKRINKLIDCKLLERCNDSKELQRSYYCFGKNYDLLTFVATCKQEFTAPVNERLQPPVNERLHDNTINPYYNIKDNKVKNQFSPSLFVLGEKEKKEFSYKVEDCYKKCIEYFPEHLHPKKTQIKNWKETIERLNRIDKVSFDLIIQVVKKTRSNDFWSKNFLSVSKLRKKNKEGIMYIVVFNEQIKSPTNYTEVFNEELSDELKGLKFK